MTRKIVTTTSSQAEYSSANNVISESRENATSKGDGENELSNAVAAVV